MLKQLRREENINQVIRGIFKYLAYSFPNSLKDKFVSRWPASGEITARLKDGLSFKYYSRCDDHIANNLYYDIEHYEEYPDLLLFSALAARSKVILDIGANTGVFSVVAALSQPQASVIAFEPYLVNARRFLKNMEINNLKNVVLAQVALGSTKGTVNFTVPVEDRICDSLSVNPEFSANFYQDEMKFKQIPVEASTLDDYLSRNSIGQVDLIKIDVESHEMEVFRGARETLQKYNPVILCEIFPDQERIDFFRDFLKPLGYHCYLLFPHGLVKVSELVNNEDCRNYLFIKDESAAPYYSFSRLDVMANTLIRKSAPANAFSEAGQ